MRDGGSASSRRAPTPSTRIRSCRWSLATSTGRDVSSTSVAGRVRSPVEWRAAGAEVVGLDPTAAQVEVARERGGGPVYLRARAEALPCRDGSFDTVLVCLALEHVDAFEDAIDEVARVLEPGGRFVLLLCHPLLQAPGSAWIDDRILGEMYWRVGAYLTEERRFHEVAPGVDLLFVHRPLSRYVHAMGRAGLLIDDMVEEAPPARVIAESWGFPEAATIPRVLLISAIRSR